MKFFFLEFYINVFGVRRQKRGRDGGPGPCNGRGPRNRARARGQGWSGLCRLPDWGVDSLSFRTGSGSGVDSMSSRAGSGTGVETNGGIAKSYLRLV